MYATQHATTRSQQRAIPPLVIDLLLDFGTREPAGDGTSKLFFDKPARRKVKAYVGHIARLLEEHVDVYAVIGADTCVITVGHR